MRAILRPDWTRAAGWIKVPGSSRGGPAARTMPEPVHPIPEPDSAHSAAGTEWTGVILPRRGFFHVPLWELLRYRDLVWMLAFRDFSSSYKQTVLGPLWYFMQPVIVGCFYALVFGRLARMGSEDLPQFVFYMGGLVPWTFFSESLLKVSGTFLTNEHILGKVYFPRLAIPVANVLTNLLPAVIQFGVFLAGWAWYWMEEGTVLRPNPWIWAVPLLMVQLGMLAFGLGCLVAAATNRFRDLAFGVKLGLQLLMFASGVVFPLTRVPEANRWIFYLNPVVPPIEFFRLGFTGHATVGLGELWGSTVVSVLVFVAGLLAFNRAEQTAMDTV